jgi:hypothetical protein
MVGSLKIDLVVLMLNFMGFVCTLLTTLFADPALSVWSLIAATVVFAINMWYVVIK